MGWFSSKRAKPLILHVDDSEDVLLMTRLVLRSLGFDTIMASDGPAGIDIAIKEKPDLILMDAQMDGMDGYEACKALKADSKTRSIPILMATGEDTVKYVDRAMGLGADNYITKPLDKERLRVKLAEMIELPSVPKS